jgi:hypothetical protein
MAWFVPEELYDQVVAAPPAEPPPTFPLTLPGSSTAIPVSTSAYHTALDKLKAARPAYDQTVQQLGPFADPAPYSTRPFDSYTGSKTGDILGGLSAILPTGIAAGQRRQNPVTEIWNTLTGQQPPQTWSNVLTNQAEDPTGIIARNTAAEGTGVGAPGETRKLTPPWETPLWARVAGFPLDVVADPMNFIPGLGPATKMSRGSKVATAVAKPLGTEVMRGLTTKGAFDILERPSNVKRGLEFASRVPGVEAVSNVVSRTNLERDLIKNALHSEAMAAEDIPKMNSVVRAAFPENPFKAIAQEGDLSPRVALPGGVTPFLTDVARYPGRYDAMLTTPERAYVQTIREFTKSITDLAKAEGVEGIPRKLDPDEVYTHLSAFPLENKPQLFETIGENLGKTPSYLKDLTYKTTDDAVAKGIGHKDPVQALLEYNAEVHRQINAKEFREIIRPRATEIDTNTPKYMAKTIADTEAEVKVLGQLKGAATNAARSAENPNWRVPVAEMRRWETVNPSYSSQLENALAIPVDRLGTSMRGAANEIKTALGISADDLITEIRGKVSPQMAEAVNPRMVTNEIKSATTQPLGVIPNPADLASTVRGAAVSQPTAVVTPGEVYAAIRKHTKTDKDAVNLVKQLHVTSWSDAVGQRKQLLTGLVDDISTNIQVLKMNNAADRKALKLLKSSQEASIAGLEQPLGEVFKAPLANTPAEISIFKDLWFSPEDTKLINDWVLRETGGTWHDVMQAALAGTNVLRTVPASGDISAMLVQMLPVLANYPKIWGEEFPRTLIGWVNKNSTYDVIRNPQYADVIRDLSPYGLNLGPSEMIGGLPRAFNFAPEWAKSANPFQRMAGEGIQEYFARSEAAFNGPMVEARLKILKGLQHRATTPQQKADLVESVNKITGGMSAASLGRGKLQEVAESALGMFAPIYTRSAGALVTDIVEGGIKGELARETVGAMLLGGTLTYVKIANMMGQKPNLDPTSSRFMTVRAGNDIIGVGSVWTAMARLFGSIVTDPESVVNGDIKKNPVAKFIIGRFAPVGGLLWEYGVTREDFTGDKLDNPVSVARNLSGHLLPMALSSQLPYLNEVPADITSAPFNFAGARVIPQSFNERRDQYALQHFGRSYVELEPPDQQSATLAIRQLGMPIRGDANIARDKAYEKYTAQMITNVDNLNAPKGDPDGLNKPQYIKVRAKATEALATELRRIDDEYPMDPKDKQKWLASLTPREQSRQRYLEIMGVKDAMGESDSDAAEAYLASQPQEVVDYINGTSAERLRNLPPDVRQVEQELRQARAILKPYWNILTEEIKRRGVYDKYQAMSPREQEEFKKTNDWKFIDAWTQSRRETLRYQNKAIDNALQEWYRRVPMRGPSSGMPGLPGLKGLPGLPGLR